MKALGRLWFVLMVVLVCLWVVGPVSAKGNPQDTGGGSIPVSDTDLLVIAAIAAIAGAILSYLINTIPTFRDGFDNIPGDWKPVVLAVFFILVALGLAALNCNNLYASAVACPAGPPDYVRLVFLALVAYSGSQVAHIVGGGKQVSSAAKYKIANTTKPSSPNG